jgi:hypothetical protein
MVAHRVRVSLGQQPTEVQDVDVVADGGDERHVVLDEKHRHAQLLAQRQQPVAELVRLLRAHTARRLVEEQQIGVGRERAAELEQLERAVGQAAEAAIAELRQSEQLEDRVRVCRQLPLPLPHRRHASQALESAVARLGVLGGEEVLEHRLGLDHADVLERAAHAHRSLAVWWHPGDVRIPVENAAGVGLVEAGDAVERSCLARTVRPHQTDDLPLVDLKAEVVDGGEAAEADGEVVHLKHGHCRHPPERRRPRRRRRAARRACR